MSFQPTPHPSSSRGSAADEGEPLTPRADALLPGTRLEELQIERVIGTSGFGLVYLANDEAFERRVAIKEYLPDTLTVRGDDGAQVLLRAASHAEAFERGRRAFIEEAKVLARVDHPSLVHVLRTWEANGTVYRAMPYYAGTSLLTLREAMESPPDEPSLRALLDGLLDALQVLHEAGTLHRGIGPNKILLLPDDRPVLMDTSAARHAIVGDQARALMTLLAPSFAPIEQTAPSLERPQGPWTDLYALAAVIKYCISGELPPAPSLFGRPPHESMAALLRRLAARMPLPHFSASFIHAIDSALAPRPEDRPQSVAELRQMLEDHPPVMLDASEPELPPADTWDVPHVMEPGEPIAQPLSAQPPRARPEANDAARREPVVSDDAARGTAARHAEPAERLHDDDRAANAGTDVAPDASVDEFAREQAARQSGESADEPANAPARSTASAETRGETMPAEAAARVATSGFAAEEATTVRGGAWRPAAGRAASRDPMPASPTVEEPSRARAESLAARGAAARSPITPTDDGRPLDGLVAPDLDFGRHARRARHRRAWGLVLLLALAAGAGAWMIGQQRMIDLAQTAFARAARHDGLTANVPAMPSSPDQSATTTARATSSNPTPLPSAPTGATRDSTGPSVSPGTEVELSAGTSAASVTSPDTTSTPSAVTTSPTASPATSPAASPTSSDRTSAAGTEVAPARDSAPATSATVPPTTVAASGRGEPVEEELPSAPRRAAPPAENPPAPATSATGTRRNAVRANAGASHSVSAALSRGAAAARMAVTPERASPRLSGPREACGNRTQFALYRCMQTQCEKWQWVQHPSCKRLRARDEVD